MLKIVKIERQKNNKERFNIYFDNKEIIGVSLYILHKYKLNLNKNLSEKDIEKIVKEENLELCKQKAFDLISRRPQSKKELEKKLNSFLYRRIKSKNLKQALIKKTFKILEKYNYLNDEKFAQWIVNQRKAQLKGPLYIKKDLLIKGISNKIIQDVLSNTNFKKELKKSFIKTNEKLRNEKNIYTKKNKIYAYLLRQGFYPEDINNIIEKVK